MSRGIDYLLDFLRAGAWPLLPGAAAAIVSDKRARAGAAFSLLIAAYVIRIGGDVFLHGRFLLPILPLLAGLAVAGISRSYDIRAWLGAIAATTIALSLSLSITGKPWPRAGDLWPPSQTARARMLAGFAAIRRKMVDHSRLAASRLNEIGRARNYRPLVAVGKIGAFGYYSMLPIVDLFGLVDPVIARHENVLPDGIEPLPGHSRSYPDYVLRRQPDFILMPKSPSDARQPLPAMVDLFAHPEFQRVYVWDPSIPAYRRE
jgi:hypothetical protein